VIQFVTLPPMALAVGVAHQIKFSLENRFCQNLSKTRVRRRPKIFL
jgi:hypothetical protein